ncbi:WG repeat-containing protein [Ferruginibacter albus]|uniref:WG repeat-containing protein n=1 Tax=Ferruginibacter albus TaxID=2875540 RepID=UPI001CC38AD7|nr:WG repeat-containing protein [Ferruginibacter albus]UAY51056.1 WG repeat-containing protein [Ferruginibacter albus]
MASKIKLRYTLFIVLYLHPGFSFCQNSKPLTNFSATEKCLYNFLSDNNYIPKSQSLNDSFYILSKDSLFMFQCPLKKTDTTYILIHLIKDGKEKCSTIKWKIDNIEYIIKGITRYNSASHYKKYFDSSDVFSSDLLAVKRNNKWGVINSFGEIIVPIEFDELKPHSLGIWAKKDVQVKIFGIRNTGSTIRTIAQSDYFDDIGITSPKFKPSGLRLTGVKKNGRNGMVNADLNLIVPIVYDKLNILGQKFLLGSRLKKIVLIDPVNGKEISSLYDKVALSNDGTYLLTSIEINGKIVQGKIDINGKEVE